MSRTEEQKRKQIRETAEDMSNLEVLKWASKGWIEKNDLDKTERDEMSRVYKRRVNNNPESFDMSDNS